MKQQLHSFTKALLALTLICCMGFCEVKPVKVSAEVENTGGFCVSGGTIGVDFDFADGLLTVKTQKALTITNQNTSSSEHIKVASGVNAHLILEELTIDTSGAGACAIDLHEAGASTVTIGTGKSVITSGKNFPGIWIPEEKKITFDGTGALTVNGGENWPGIGRTGNGNILIDGPVITANGGLNAAGIGGSSGFNGGIIMIKSGVVTAKGGENAAGIGGGYRGLGGTITIDGGTVNATGGGHGAGIGSSWYASYGKITINSGHVTATGGLAGAGIGSGDVQGSSENGESGSITINGGTIIATAPNSMGDPAAIGGGAFKQAGTIAIHGGTITANGSQKGIGSGASASGGSILIDGGTVTANGIGTGGYESSATTNIKGGLVVCTDAQYGGINQTNKSSFSGIVVEGGAGQVYGEVTLREDTELNYPITIPSGSKLSVLSGVHLINNRSIQNNGTILNNGTIKNSGSINGNEVTGDGTVINGIGYLSCDENGRNFKAAVCQTGDYRELSTDTALTNGWYVLKQSITVSDRVIVTGDVHLILTDGCTYNAAQGINVSKGNSLTIYAQSTDKNRMGRILCESVLQANAGIGGREDSGNIDLKDCGTITINGGNIKVTAGDYAAGIGGGANGYGGNITINGGYVSATTTDNSANQSTKPAAIGGGANYPAENVTINGGTVRACGAAKIGIGRGGTIRITGGIVYSGTVCIDLSSPGSTQITGGLVVLTDKISSKSGQLNGVVFESGIGTMYNDYTLTEDVTLSSNMDGLGSLYELTIPSGRTLTIPEGITLTTDIKITVEKGGRLQVDGTLNKGGALRNELYNMGTITGIGEIKSSSMIFNNGGTVDLNITGNVTKSEMPSVPHGYSLVVPAGTSLTLNCGVGCAISCEGTLIMNSYNNDFPSEVVSVSEGASLTVKGDLYHAGTILCNGTVNCKGNAEVGYLTCNGSFTCDKTFTNGKGITGTGKVYSNSSFENNGPISGVDMYVKGQLSGAVYGNITLSGPVEVPSGKTLSIGGGQTLTVPAGITVVNNGTVSLYGTLQNNGTFQNKGTFYNSGNLYGSEITGNAVQKDVVLYRYCDQYGRNWQIGAAKEFTVLDEDATEIGTVGQDSYYVVRGETTVNGRLQVSGNVHLILTDGCTLNAKKGIGVVNDNTITIYSQSEDKKKMGTLYAYGGENAAIGSNGGKASGRIIINGGRIVASANRLEGYMCAIGGGPNEKTNGIQINDGYIQANGSIAGKGGFITFKGGITVADDVGRGTDKKGNFYYASVNSEGGIVFSAGTIQFQQEYRTGLLISTRNFTLTGMGDNVVLTEDVFIPEGGTLTLATNQTITVAEGANIYNNGTIAGEGTLQCNGNIYGDGTIAETILGEHAEKEPAIAKGDVLTIPAGGTFTVKEGETLDVNGTIIIYGTLDIQGTLTGNGTIQNYGKLNSDGTFTANDLFQNNGAITGQGSVVSNGRFENDGRINVTGTIERNGEFVQKNGISVVDGFYELYSADDLQEFAELVNKGYENLTIKGKLMASVDISDRDFVIGKDVFYQGEFDGNCYSIKVNYKDGKVLFAHTDKATIRNLWLTGTMEVIETNKDRMCSFAGGSVTLINCLGTVTGTVKSTGEQIKVPNKVNTFDSNQKSNGSCYLSDESNYWLGARTAAQFASGEVAWDMNNWQKTPFWSQGEKGPVRADETHPAVVRLHIKIGKRDQSYYFKVGDNITLVSDLIHSNTTCCSVITKDLEVTIDKVGKKEPTCVEDGYEEHFKCSACGKLFGDAEGNNKIDAPVPISMIPHTYGEWIEYVPGTEEAHGILGHYECSGCHQYFDAGKKLLKSLDTDHKYEDGFCSFCGAYQPAVENKAGFYEISNAGQLMWFSAYVNGTLPDATEKAGNANAILTADINLNKGYLFSYEADTGLIKVSGDTSFYLGTGKKGDGSGSDSSFDTEASLRGKAYALSGNTYTEEEEADDVLRAFTPIGFAAGGGPVYGGVFDGAGHSISGVYINREESYIGFIAYLQLGTVKNLTIQNSYTKGNDAVGGVVGLSAISAKVFNCTNDAIVVGAGWIGGVVGQIHEKNGRDNHVGLINRGMVFGFMYEGGIAGQGGNLRNSYNLGFVYASGGFAGGIIGSTIQRVELCVNGGTISSPGVKGDIEPFGEAKKYFCEAIPASDERWSNGYVTRFLNRTVSEDGTSFTEGPTDGTQIFYQTLDDDLTPQFSGGTVYYVKKSTCAGKAFSPEQMIYSNQEPANTLLLTPEKEAAENEAGYAKYYRCSECGKYYSDADGFMEIDAPIQTAVLRENVPYQNYNEGIFNDDVQAACGKVTNDLVRWYSGWYVAEGEVTISERVRIYGDVKLILTDSCTLNVNNGIQVPEGATLTVYAQENGTGTVVAKITSAAGTRFAGIGGSTEENAGTMNLCGGVIYAQGTYDAAGIGGGNQGADGSGVTGGFTAINIHGGTIHATGGTNGAAIGSGCWGGGNQTDNGIGSILIENAVVYAKTDANQSYVAAIGRGFNFTENPPCSVTIRNSIVSAENKVGDKAGNSISGAVRNGEPSISDSLVFVNNGDNVAEDTVLIGGYVIPDGKSVTVPAGATLTLAENAVLTNYGTITVNGTFNINGLLKGNLPIRDGGTINGSFTIEIADEAQMKQFVDLVNAGGTGIGAILTADLTLTDTEAMVGYKGVFEGNGHCITRNGGYLFTSTDGAEIKNVGVINAGLIESAVDGSVTGCFSTTSGLCGSSQATTISNSYYLLPYTDENGGKTSSQFSSGEVAWLLNTNGGTDINGKLWSQGFMYPVKADAVNGAVVRLCLTGAWQEISYKKAGDPLPALSELIFSSAYTEGSVIFEDMELTAEMALISASPTITDSIALNYKVVIQNALLGGDTPKLTFTFRGEETMVEGVAGKNENGYTTYLFTFRGILPQFMRETLKAELTVGTAVVKKTEYSICDYAFRTLEKTSEELHLTEKKAGEFRTLLVDLLYYGADSQLYLAAQKEQTVDENQLATYGLSEDQKKLRTADLTENATRVFACDTPTEGDYTEYTWDSGNFVLTDRVCLRFKFTAPDLTDLTVKVFVGDSETPTEVIREFQKIGDGDQYRFDFSKLSATLLGESVRLQICVNDAPIGSNLTYSLNSYVRFAMDKADLDDELKALMRSLYGYECSAAAYIKPEIQ